MWFLAFLLSLRIDHFLIIATLVSFLIGKGRAFIRDWFPFLLLWISYDMLRGVADNLTHVFVTPIFYLELWTFGTLCQGTIPAFYLQQYKRPYLTWIAGGFYTLHMAMPIFVGLLLWINEDSRPLFKEMSYAFLLTSYSALITFALFPVAPPWYIWGHGFSQPQQKVGLKESAAGLLDLDRFTHHSFFGSIYETFNSNPFAAFPSLHAAYSFFSSYYLIRRFGKRALPSLIYPIGMCFSAVYLLHHYVIDLVAGIVYSSFWILLVHSFLSFSSSLPGSAFRVTLPFSFSGHSFKSPFFSLSFPHFKWSLLPSSAVLYFLLYPCTCDL